MKGKIKRLIRDRRFGFITAEDGKEFFFHGSALDGMDFDALEEGNSVEFNSERGPKGLRAVNIRGLMQAYCMKCRAKREIKNPKAVILKNGRPATQGVCPICGTKVSRIGKS